MDLYIEKPITGKWLTELKNNLKRKPVLEKRFCFLGFPQSHPNVERICLELEAHKKVINDFSATGGWKTPYHISESYSLDSVLQGGQLDQDMMNRLHHHFEILSGQIWNESQFKSVATAEVKYAIHQLNLLCHELESLLAQFKNYLTREVYRPLGAPSTIFSFLHTDRVELADEDLDYFEYYQDFGLVNLHYAQIGKRWDEAYHDQDEHVFDSGISGLRYYTGEFNIYWGHADRQRFHQEEKAIRDWARTRGADPNDRRMALGWIYVGEFNRQKNFGSMDTDEIYSLMSQHLDLYQIHVHDEGEIVSQTFDYTDRDEDYDRRQIDLIRRFW